MGRRADSTRDGRSAQTDRLNFEGQKVHRSKPGIGTKTEHRRNLRPSMAYILFRVTHDPAQPGEDQGVCDCRAVDRTRSGDASAFEQIVRSYSGMLFGLSYRMLGDREDAADAVQEIFVRAFAALDSFNQSRPFHPWLYAIAVNHLRSVLRTRTRRPRPVSIEGTRDNDSAWIDPIDRSPGPERSTMMQLAERDAQTALDRLPQKYREVFVLRAIENLSVNDVARILRIPPGTVKTRQHRARRLLADALTEDQQE
jgi:RNA polymerase sigma-70 factor, ECF subfamily